MQTQPSGGPYEDIWSQKRWGSTGPVRNQPPYSDTPSRLVLPVDCRMVLMIPACCVQQDRFPTCEHGMTSRPLDCYHPSGRESKTSTKRSARNSPPSLGMRDCRPRSFRFQNGHFISSFSHWSRIFLKNKSIPVSLFTYPFVTRIFHSRIVLRKDFSAFHPTGRFSQISCFLEFICLRHFSGPGITPVFPQNGSL